MCACQVGAFVSCVLDRHGTCPYNHTYIPNTKYINPTYLVGVCPDPHVLYPNLRGMGHSHPAGLPAVNGTLKACLKGMLFG